MLPEESELHRALTLIYANRADKVSVVRMLELASWFHDLGMEHMAEAAEHCADRAVEED